jgi:hypothetical protein
MFGRFKHTSHGLRQLLGTEGELTVLIVKQQDKSLWLYIYPLKRQDSSRYRVLYSKEEDILWSAVPGS